MNENFDTVELLELDCRSGDGIEVRLLWEPRGDRVFVTVDDVRSLEHFRIHVDAATALDAFHHPFAYDRRLAGELSASAA